MNYQISSDTLGMLWMTRLDKPLPEQIHPLVSADFSQAGPEIASELAGAIGHNNPEIILQRFHMGKHCYIASIAGTIASYGWITFDQEDIGELGISIHLKEGEAYIWDCATLPLFRGQLLYTALLAHMLTAMRHAGLQRVWIGADADNFPSQRGIERVGCHPVLEFIKRSPAGYTTCGYPGADPQDVRDALDALFGKR
jgi:ribosomal protein S18 acetylase RimI-like enzyme